MPPTKRQRKRTEDRPVRRSAAEASHVEPHLVLPSEGAIGYQLRTIAEQLRAQLQERLNPLGVREGQWQYLRVLWEHDGITQRELGKRVSRMGPNTVTALSILERSGFVRRERSRVDQRVVHVYLTPKARAIQDRMAAAAIGVTREAMAGVEEHDLIAFLRVLRTMQRNLGKQGE